MGGLTWLHLSDWHQNGEDLDHDRTVVRDALLKDIYERTKIHTDLENLDFIVFSGDAAYHGKKKEYDAAMEHLFKPVLEAAGLGNDRLFIVPGNHDLDRERRIFPACPRYLYPPGGPCPACHEYRAFSHGRTRTNTDNYATEDGEK